MVEEIFGETSERQQTHLAVYKVFRVLQRSDDISISSVYVSAVCVRVGNGENRMDMAGDRVAVGSEMDDHRVCARV